MNALIRKPSFRILATTAVIAAGLAASTLTSTPAQARVFIGSGFGVPGFWGYYPPPAYYYPYSRYYGYPYYRYPYSYPAGVYFGRPFYWHRHHYWHRRWR